MIPSRTELRVLKSADWWQVDDTHYRNLHGDKLGTYQDLAPWSDWHAWYFLLSDGYLVGPWPRALEARRAANKCRQSRQSL